MIYSFRVIKYRTVLAGLALAMLCAIGGLSPATPAASADAVAYLVNVTVRPGYNFASAEHALSYGRGVCGKIAAGTPYAQLIADVQTDFRTSAEFAASYLITQAANELCPAQIWQLRESAAGYTALP